MSLRWAEANTSGVPLPNPNGILEPGEHALITLDVSFSNQFGSASFSPPVGPFSSGTILGFGSGFVDIRGTGDAVGTFNVSTPTANSTGTSGFGVRGDWRLPLNYVVTPDSILNVQFAQSAATPSAANTANPIPNMFRFLWTPTNLNPRTVHFAVAGSLPTGDAITSVYLNLGSSFGAVVYINPTNLILGSVSIPIAPAPGSLLALCLAAPAAMRRRR